MKEKLEKDRLAKEAKDAAEKERLAKLEEERAEKVRKEELARKEKEAAEQAKILAAQQAARERAKVEKAVAEKLAAEKAIKDKARQEAAARSIAPTPVSAPKKVNGLPHPSQITPPLPVQPVSARSAPSTRPSKPPQPFLPPTAPQSAMPPISAFSSPNRLPIPTNFTPGFRPGFPPSQSPVFSPPQSNGQGMATSGAGPSISPNPLSRSYQEPSPPAFEHAHHLNHNLRTAPIGMGFPSKSSPGSRLPLLDETYISPPGSSISQLSQASHSQPQPHKRVGSVSELNGMMSASDDFRRLAEPSPIAPPGPIGSIGSSMSTGSIGSGLGSASIGGIGAIGRPSVSQVYEPPQSSSSSSVHSQPMPGMRSNSPPQGQVFGSAALGGDDEIVQPQRRVLSNGWEIPAVAAPGAGRWSSASSIWGGGNEGINNTWGGLGSAPGQGRQSSFAGLPGSTNPVGGGHGLQGMNGYNPGPGGTGLGGQSGNPNGFPQNLFSPPIQHPQHPH